MFWSGSYHFDKVLPFGLCSAPFNYNQLSDAIEWILQNNCAISFVCRILDDFLIIEPPAPTAPFNSFCQVSISNMILSFKNLNILISAAKTEVPAKLFSSWELFSIHMQWKPGCQRTRFSGLKPPSASFDPSDLQPCKSFNC